MTRRMLINAQNPTELRIALTQDKELQGLKIDVAERGLTRGNIYFGVIANIQPSLNAAFIDYGAERHGFLAIQDVVRDAFYRPAPDGKRPKIEDVLQKGKSIVVQVTREPEGQKGAALTTNLSLAGRYLVLMPFEEMRGVSRKVESEEMRLELKALADALKIPEGFGVIVRTNALGQNKTALSRDLNALLRLWKRIGTEARRSKGHKLLYSDQDVVLQALRDYLDTSVEEVLVDDEEAHAKSEQYMRTFMPRSKTKLIRYEDRAPIFSSFDLEPQIDRIYERQVALPSGGSLVIDPTEALTAIDVNSGRSTGAASQEETAVHTNVEAANEVARQLRLRDIGGLIVVDFIDMRSLRSRRKIEKTLRDALKQDKARASITKLSQNGLLEINRQRLQQAIQLRTQRACPTCTGTGRIASPEIVGLRLLRAIEARAADGFMKGVRIALHPELADAFQNQHRGELVRIESEYDVTIEIIASSKLHRPEQEIDWYARERAEIKRLEKEQQEARKLADALAATPTIGDEPDEEADLDDLFDASEEEADGAEPAPRTRRRSRRGGKKRTARRRAKAAKESKGTAKSDKDAEAKETDAATDTKAAKDSDTGSDDGEARTARKRRRRRPRRRRKPAVAEGETARAAKSEAEGSESETSNGDGEPSRPRRRRAPRRRRRPSSNGDGEGAARQAASSGESVAPVSSEPPPLPKPTILPPPPPPPSEPAD